MAQWVEGVAAMSHDANQPEEVRCTVCHDPATGEIIGHSRQSDALEVKEAVDRSRRAQANWAGTPVQDRAACVLAVRDHIVRNADELASVISRDNGKTRVDALATEVIAAAMAAAYYARRGESFLATERLGASTWLLANKRSGVTRIPYGVVGIISPWNYPFAIPFSEVVMGLLAGNGVVLKAASETQMVGRALEACIAAGGFPEGLFGYVNLPGREAGAAMLSAGVDKLFFTGSVSVGKTLMAEAAKTLTPLVLELGGNDAMLVFEDADLERAASGAVWAGFQNAGQSCGGVERVYVHQDVWEEFMALLKARVESLRVGPDRAFDVDMGAMTTARQLQTVRDHVEDALARGAVLFASSPAPGGPGLFHPAVVLTNVDHSMRVMREETFGPVVGVMKVKDMEEALGLANDSDLGLTGSVWSRDIRKAEALARRIRAGVVTVNDHLMSHGLPETPWGGFEESGIGRTHGRIGFDEMTQPQVLVRHAVSAIRHELWWHPHGPDVYGTLRAMLGLLYGPGLKARFRGLLAIVKALPRMLRAS
jgi:succinate-semialdehyde dehydrogenase/glutarate-semialdehyde dehydrogenase